MHHSIAVFITNFFANFLELREGEVQHRPALTLPFCILRLYVGSPKAAGET